MQTETTTRDDVRGEVHRLRAQLERVQGRRMDAPVLPVLEPFAEVLPGGGLRTGSAYSLARSSSLVSGLLAGPSQNGTWCAVVGMPDFGVEAAESAGVDLSHLVLVPDPGPRWLAVAATLAEVIPVVAVRPASRTADAEVSRLGACLRDRGAVLLCDGQYLQIDDVDACVAALEQVGVPIDGPITAFNGDEVLTDALQGASCSVEEPKNVRFAGGLFALLGLGLGATFLRRRRS